mgnify:CR=1 FL=1
MIEAADSYPKMLNEDHKRLYEIYQRVLTLCNEEPAIAKGVFFDLMYANQNGWRFNEIVASN